MLDFQGLGWEVRLRFKRRNYFLTLAKEVVLGNGLKQGDLLKYFLVKYQGKNCILISLEDDLKEIQKVQKNVFLVQ